MRDKKFFGWLLIVWALACAVGIFFIAAFNALFLSMLLLGLVGAFVVRKQCSKPAVVVCQLLVGALFVFSSLAKGIDPLGTKYKMIDYFAAYNISWLNDMAMPLAVAMILLEFIVGICLMTNVFPRLATLGATLLMLFFTTTTLLDALFELVPDCGCFGTAVKMSNWQTFYKNIVIDMVLIALIFNNKKLVNRLTIRGQLLIGLVYAVIFLAFEMYNYRHLPIIDTMSWKVGNSMVATERQEPEIYLTFRDKNTGKTQEFLSPNYPWNDSLWMSQWEFVDQRSVGESAYLGFSALDEEGNDMTDMILTSERLFVFTSTDMNKITEAEWHKIADIVAAAEEHGLYVLWVTSSTPDIVQKYMERYEFLYEVYYADEVEIKMMVRYNPGLLLMHEGVVVDKWSAVDFPSSRQFETILDKL